MTSKCLANDFKMLGVRRQHAFAYDVEMFSAAKFLVYAVDVVRQTPGCVKGVRQALGRAKHADVVRQAFQRCS